jgi:deferrochelatase/peroxidase EfeB
VAGIDLRQTVTQAPVPASEFSDMQGLLYSGYSTLTEACFLLLRIADPAAARAWLSAVEVTTADKRKVTAAVQVALSVDGLQALGVAPAAIAGFSAEFLTGMAGQESRSRRLGDVGSNAPSQWVWGAVPPHVAVLLYAANGGLAALRQQVETAAFAQAFALLRVLDTTDMGGREPFGFTDGVSQPSIDWQAKRSPDEEAILPYGNLISAGEFVLGYPNEYGQYTDRPLLDANDPAASILPQAADAPHRRDLGRNGSYLVLRELRQDVRAFWQFAATHADDPAGATALAEAIVGRRIDGGPLESLSAAPIEGVGPDPSDITNNQFTYVADAAGLRCPIGAHVRRANPRTGDMPGAPLSLLPRLIRLLGIGQTNLQDDLIAASRFHRLLRRGREFGKTVAPEQAMRADAPAPSAGLHFICLNGNIARQFEFIQNAWLQSPKFAGLGDEADPLIANRQPVPGGEGPGAVTDNFSLPQQNGVRRRITGLPQFITVAGGGYFFLPGRRALRYLAGATTSAGSFGEGRAN